MKTLQGRLTVLPMVATTRLLFIHVSSNLRLFFKAVIFAFIFGKGQMKRLTMASCGRHVHSTIIIIVIMIVVMMMIIIIFYHMMIIDATLVQAYWLPSLQLFQGLGSTMGPNLLQ